MLLNQHITEIIEEEVSKLVKDMKKNLSKAGKGSSSLSKSIMGEVKDMNAEITMNDYGQFIDKGVTGNNSSNFKGKKKSVYRSKGNFKFGSGNSRGSSEDWEKKIDRWMSSKGISGGKDSKGNKISKDSINYLIRRSIYQHGIKPTMFATKAWEKFEKNLRKRLNNIDITEFINIKR